MIDCHGQTHERPTFMCDAGVFRKAHGQDNHDQYHGIHAEDLRKPDRNLPAGRAQERVSRDSALF